jgi:hypothetical protein
MDVQNLNCVSGEKPAAVLMAFREPDTLVRNPPARYSTQNLRDSFYDEARVVLGEDLSASRVGPRICENVPVASRPPCRAERNQRVTPTAPNLRQTDPEQPIATLGPVHLR